MSTNVFQDPTICDHNERLYTKAIFVFTAVREQLNVSDMRYLQEKSTKCIHEIIIVFITYFLEDNI